jgi:hypothetical protein
MKITKMTLSAVMAASTFASVATVRADITGYLWDSSVSGLVDNGPNAYVPANPPGVNPSVTFTVPNGSLTFNSQNAGNGYTIGGFLGTGNATITGGTEGTLDNTKSLDDTLIQLVGSVSVVNGQGYTVQHDDGVVLTIDGQTLVNQPQPSSPSNTPYTWTGPTGTFAFDLLYAEVDGAPAVLETDLPLTQSVPEPTTMVAGALMLLPFGASTLRILRKNRMA